MTFLTPIILGMIIISALAGIAYIGLSIYDIFIRRDFEDFESSQRLYAIYKIFKVSVILALILSVLELYLWWTLLLQYSLVSHLSWYGLLFMVVSIGWDPKLNLIGMPNGMIRIWNLLHISYGGIDDESVCALQSKILWNTRCVFFTWSGNGKCGIRNRLCVWVHTWRGVGMMRKFSRVWTEDSPRTVDLMMDTVLWLVGLTVLNTVLIGMILWTLFSK